MKDFISDLNDLKKRFMKYTPARLHALLEFERQCELLFEAHADALWPPQSVNRSQWLVDARTDDLDGFYKENLHANDGRERNM